MSTGFVAAVVVASNRAAARIYDDTTGPLIVEALRADGWEVAEPVVVPDGDAVGEAISTAVADGARRCLACRTHSRARHVRGPYRAPSMMTAGENEKHRGHEQRR